MAKVGDLPRFSFICLTINILLTLKMEHQSILALSATERCALKPRSSRGISHHHCPFNGKYPRFSQQNFRLRSQTKSDPN
jgi:hypothetical protein